MVSLGASSRAEESSERRSKQRSASGGFCLADATTDSSCATRAPNRDSGIGSPPATPRFAMRKVGEEGAGGRAGVWADGLFPVPLGWRSRVDVPRGGVLGW